MAPRASLACAVAWRVAYGVVGQVGDVVKKCSAVFGEDMWQAIDIRRIRWAINNRTSKASVAVTRRALSGGL